MSCSELDVMIFVAVEIGFYHLSCSGEMYGFSASFATLMCLDSFWLICDLIKMYRKRIPISDFSWWHSWPRKMVN